MSKEVVAGIRQSIRGVFGEVAVNEGNRKGIEALVEAMMEGGLADHEAVSERFDSVIEDLENVRDAYRFKHDVGAPLMR